SRRSQRLRNNCRFTRVVLAIASSFACPIQTNIATRTNSYASSADRNVSTLLWMVEGAPRVETISTSPCKNIATWLLARCVACTLFNWRGQRSCTFHWTNLLCWRAGWRRFARNKPRGERRGMQRRNRKAPCASVTRAAASRTRATQDASRRGSGLSPDCDDAYARRRPRKHPWCWPAIGAGSAASIGGVNDSDGGDGGAAPDLP